MALLALPESSAANRVRRHPLSRVILVTGAAGNIGARLTRAMLKRGEKPRALVVPGDPLRCRVEGLG